jgi:hypothetical protein
MLGCVLKLEMQKAALAEFPHWGHKLTVDHPNVDKALACIHTHIRTPFQSPADFWTNKNIYLGIRSEDLAWYPSDPPWSHKMSPEQVTNRHYPFWDVNRAMSLNGSPPECLCKGLSWIVGIPEPGCGKRLSPLPAWQQGPIPMGKAQQFD